MSSTAIVTMTKMMETLPEATQNQVIKELRAYIAELQDEIRWNNSFKRSSAELVKAAQRAKEEIAAGKSTPLDYNQL
ncbi:MAG: hypothetical protein K8R89_04675 [Anaerolineae bacterium]|nr:hypothetical protein [Anaerolineae bacterium]